MSAITVEKGFDAAYSAYLLLKAEDANWTFDVFGKGLPPSEYPEATFHGVVSGEAKRAAFARGGVFLLPSRYVNETQPLCLLEALFVGMPIVASDVGGISEIVGLGEEAAGIVLSEITPSTLANAVRLAHSREKDYGMAGMVRYKKLFSAEAFDTSLDGLMRGTSAPVIVV